MRKPIDAQEAIDTLEITRVLFTNFRTTDAKQWDEFEATLADKVAIDFVGVQSPATVTARELRGTVRAELRPGKDATHVH